MNVIDSPVDALVFDYVRIGVVTVVNSLWAWVAVITAAVSFWRIRTLADAGAAPALTAGSSSLVNPSRSCPVSPPAVEPAPAPEPVPEPSTSESSRPAAAPSSSGFCEGGSVSLTKGKFVVYYEEESGRDDGSGEGDGEGELTEWSNGGDGVGEWWSCWEMALEVRRGEMGWYRYQDLTALSGNVVRLWDGVRRDSLVW